MLRPLARHALQSNPPGTRVVSNLTGCFAMISGTPEKARASLVLVPVMIEGSTRHELWPTHHTTVLPAAQQFRALGGRVEAPPGYPLIPVPA